MFPLVAAAEVILCAERGASIGHKHHLTPIQSSHRMGNVNPYDHADAGPPHLENPGKWGTWFVMLSQLFAGATFGFLISFFINRQSKNALWEKTGAEQTALYEELNAKDRELNQSRSEQSRLHHLVTRSTFAGVALGAVLEVNNRGFITL